MSPRSRDLPRRSCHAVPGSNPHFIAKAQSLPADMVFLDLEDAVAPTEKEAARPPSGTPLRGAAGGDMVVAVRVNDWSTRWNTFDILEVVGRAGRRLDEIVLPEVESPAQVVAADVAAADDEGRGAVRFGDEMLDEASHTMPLKVVARGERAGLVRTSPR
jgi:citrate lyase subunit beta / citryl-CoA lyase